MKEVDQADLQVAKRTVAQRFIVGLADEYDESLRRFGIMLNFRARTTVEDRYASGFTSSLYLSFEIFSHVLSSKKEML